MMARKTRADASRRGEPVRAPGGQTGRLVGTLGGVRWVCWDDGYEAMCAAFDRLARARR